MANPNVLNMRGTAAARPAAGIDGRHYWAYDTKAMSRDNGSTWETVTPAAGASGSILAIDGSGDLAYTPTLTQGDAFPVSPSDADQHFRTDLGDGWVWDDTLGVWLGPERFYPLVAQYDITTGGFGTLQPRIALASGKQFLVTSWRFTYIGGDDAWTIFDSYIFTLDHQDAGGSGITMATFTIDSYPGGGSSGEAATTTLTSNLTALTDVGICVTFNYTGAPGTLVYTYWGITMREAIAP